MIAFGILLGLVIMGVMIYLALNKKSTFYTRIAALAALAIMVITVIICLIMIFSETSVPVDPSTMIVGEPVEVSEEGKNILPIIFFIFFLIALLVVIAVTAMNEHKKSAKK